MKENKYDDATFFDKYSQMDRSQKGLEGAGEWHELQKLLPDFHGKRVLDLGCGFGWHCRYAVEQGAASAVGVDISEKMLEGARSRTDSSAVRYVRAAFEDIDFPAGSFDVVISSLAFHYTPDFSRICAKVRECLTAGGDFVFSVEHPVFTACGTQDWVYDGEGKPLHWPVDRYFIEGKRETRFLGEEVVKYHKTLTTYVHTLLTGGFELTGLVEPQPAPELLHTVPGMEEELRRPMMLLVAARKR
ncbi:MAG: class I SAM-dependent methyltransferase [Clostridiales bacterium]|nr:class I SAM-dependent methyltransferase [Clostridiales bacterium]